MLIQQMWYQKYRCECCNVVFTQYPALLGCARPHGVQLFNEPYKHGILAIDSKIASPRAIESMNWVTPYVLHPCSDSENGVARLIGFTTQEPQVKSGELRELRGDQIPQHLRDTLA